MAVVELVVLGVYIEQVEPRLTVVVAPLVDLKSEIGQPKP